MFFPIRRWRELPAKSQAKQPSIRARVIRSLAACALTWLAAVAHGADALGPGELAQRINPSSDCTRAAVVGLCYCGYTPCGYWLEMYIPAVFVETVVRPGDTLLATRNFAAQVGKGGGTLATGSASLSTTDNTAEAHVWALSDSMMQASALQPCLVCKPSDSHVPAASGGSSLSSPCDPSGQIAAEILSAAAGVNIPYMPSLQYASEIDFTNWHTGCRDLSLANALASNGFTCSAVGVAQWLGGGDALSRLIGADACVGAWGPLYPRQMRDIGNNPVVHSAKTSYRAMSIARDQLGQLPIPVDLAGRMQQAFPNVSACFGVGTLPLPEPGWSAQPTVASADGRYGWFYWRPVACCKRFDDYASCMQQQQNGK